MPEPTSRGLAQRGPRLIIFDIIKVRLVKPGAFF